MKLLVGYGNALRQDDGVGCLLANHFAPHADAKNLRVLCVHQLMPEIAASVAEAACVVFVDACLEGQAGEVRVQTIHASRKMGDAHVLHPTEILYLTSYLYGRCPSAYLVTIAGESFDLGEGLSQAVQKAMPKAINLLESLLHSSNIA